MRNMVIQQKSMEKFHTSTLSTVCGFLFKIAYFLLICLRINDLRQTCFCGTAFVLAYSRSYSFYMVFTSTCEAGLFVRTITKQAR